MPQIRQSLLFKRGQRKVLFFYQRFLITRFSLTSVKHLFNTFGPKFSNKPCPEYKKLSNSVSSNIDAAAIYIPWQIRSAVGFTPPWLWWEECAPLLGRGRLPADADPEVVPPTIPVPTTSVHRIYLRWVPGCVFFYTMPRWELQKWLIVGLVPIEQPNPSLVSGM